MVHIFVPVFQQAANRISNSGKNSRAWLDTELRAQLGPIILVGKRLKKLILDWMV